MSRFTGFTTHDVRFPTSRDLDGSDAMNPDPDYSAAYLVIGTDDPDGLEGHGFAFTIGRGNDVQVAAIDALAGHLLGRDVDAVLADMGATSRSFVDDSQLRWLGPEKGVMHMAISAVVNALWDLKAKRAGLPLWDLLSRMSPEELVDLVDFRYLTDALTREEALEILRRAEPGRAARREELLERGFPAYTTTPGWLGYSDEKLVRLAHEAVAEGFSQIKLKVGADVEDDVRRLRLAREAVGPDVRIASTPTSAGTSGGDRLGQPARAVRPLVDRGTHEPRRRPGARGDPARGEPRQGRDGGARPEPDRLQAAAAGWLARRPADRRRPRRRRQRERRDPAAGGEVRRPGLPARGRGGLCELVQHLSMVDFVAVAGTTQDRVIEFVDHLHEHFTDPVVSPTAPTAPRRRPGSARRCGRRPWRTSPSRTAPSGGPCRRRTPSTCTRGRCPRDGGILRGLAVLVTGGASGIGAATAARFTAEGARVVVLDRDDSAEHRTVRADLSDDASVRAAVASAVGHLGALDVLVNNAGVGAVGDVTANDDDTWHRVYDVNVVGLVRTTRAALPHLRRAAAERGTAAVVNTCSIAAWTGLPQRALYSATKGAVQALTLAMAADHLADGIRVNCVNPGTADTPWVQRLLDASDDPAAERAALQARQPTGRLVTPEEVAHAIVHLADPRSGATTGTVLAVDGGMHALRVPARPQTGGTA